MDFGDDTDLELITEAVGAVCAGFDDDYWSACDQEHRFPWEFYERMAEGGWIGIAIPEQYDGAGRGITEATVVLRTVAASGAAMNGCSAIHLTIFGLNPVVVFGSDRLKDTFLPRAAAGDLHVAFGVTEPDAGTDTSRISTRATRDGDGWRINGRKIWTSKALESEVVLLLARTGEADTGFDGLSLFLADLDHEYVDIRPISKAGRNAVASCEVFYDDLPVEGWRLVRLDAAWLQTMEAAWRYDHGMDCGAQANAAKYLAAEAAYAAADQAVQTLGGMGYATEYHVERYWREARIQRLAPVSQEMTLNYVAQHVLGLPRSY